MNHRPTADCLIAGFGAQPVSNTRHRGFRFIAVPMNVLPADVGHVLLKSVLLRIEDQQRLLPVPWTECLDVAVEVRIELRHGYFFKAPRASNTRLTAAWILSTPMVLGSVGKRIGGSLGSRGNSLRLALRVVAFALAVFR